jgi:hypothetical protein
MNFQKLLSKIAHRLLLKHLIRLQEDDMIARQAMLPKITCHMVDVGVTILPIIQISYEKGRKSCQIVIRKRICKNLIRVITKYD